MRLAQLPMLTYDELTVLCSALAAQVGADRDTLQISSSLEVQELCVERVKICRSILTACLEARDQTDRQHGHELEPLRQAWEQQEIRSAAWL